MSHPTMLHLCSLVGNALAIQALAEKYKGLTLSKSSEPLTANFFEAVLSLHNRLVKKMPGVFSKLLELDELPLANPLDSVTKLHDIISKTRDAPKAEWTILYLCDWIVAGGAPDLTTRALKGTNASAGLIDVIVSKMHVRGYLFEVMEKENFRPEMREKMRVVAESVSKAREHFGHAWVPGKKVPDQAWQAGWTKSEAGMASLFENVVFGPTYDQALRVCIDNRRAISEFFAHGLLKVQPRLSVETATLSGRPDPKWM